jgi:hypothetical protein
MRDSWLRFRTSFRLPLASAGRSHKQRNVLSAIPRRERDNVQAELAGIWEQPSKAEALSQLPHHRLGHDPGYSVAQNLASIMLRRRGQRGTSNQPGRVVQGEAAFCAFSGLFASPQAMCSALSQSFSEACCRLHGHAQGFLSVHVHT